MLVVLAVPVNRYYILGVIHIYQFIHLMMRLGNLLVKNHDNLDLNLIPRLVGIKKLVKKLKMEFYGFEVELKNDYRKN